MQSPKDVSTINMVLPFVLVTAYALAVTSASKFFSEALSSMKVVFQGQV